MPRRKQILATNEIYHLVNRGVASSEISNDKLDYYRFQNLINYYRFSDANLSFSAFQNLNNNLRKGYMDKLKASAKADLEIYAYCLMPNHFHLLVKQLKEKGIETVFSKIQNAYAKYFNLKNNRLGPLFQSRFKASLISSEEIFLHVSRYIHLNPVTSYLLDINELKNYSWSSYPEYLGLKEPAFTNVQPLLKIVGGVKKYNKFVTNQTNYQRELNKIKKFILT